MPLPQCKRIDFDDEAGRLALLADGWREIEVLVTWEYRGTPEHLKPWIEKLVPIARAAFVHDRLHRDPLVPKDEADAAKEAWVRGAFINTPGVMSHGRPPQGFLIWKTDRDVKIIDLVAVAPEHQNKGVGALLVRKAIEEWPGPIRAGTQEHNLGGMALYKKMGFEIVKRQRTFHK